MIEHVEQPVELLEQFKKILNKNGILFISVPNRNFIRAKSDLISGKLPEANYPPHHISFWNEKSLNFAMQKAGLKTVKTSIQSYPEYMQTEITLKKHLPILLARYFAKASAIIGKRMNIQGVHLFSYGSSND